MILSDTFRDDSSLASTTPVRPTIKQQQPPLQSLPSRPRTTRRQQRHLVVTFQESANTYHDNWAMLTIYPQDIQNLWYSSRDYDYFQTTNNYIIKSILKAERQQQQKDNNRNSYTNVLKRTYGACCCPTPTKQDDDSKMGILTAALEKELQQAYEATPVVYFRVGLTSRLVNKISSRHPDAVRQELYYIVQLVQYHQQLFQSDDKFRTVLRRECEKRSLGAQRFAHHMACAQRYAST